MKKSLTFTFLAVESKKKKKKIHGRLLKLLAKKRNTVLNNNLAH